jgi:hypothetical protein|eukprot:COSAG01_NODE_1557_length_9928_cov_7.869977_3_plen_50_part_00
MQDWCGRLEELGIEQSESNGAADSILVPVHLTRIYTHQSRISPSGGTLW